jgi:hypothetical protein
MTVVVVTPRGKTAEAIVRQLLPRSIVTLTAQCCYHFFDVVGGGPPESFTFTDIDGEVLTEYRTLETLEAAESWVSEDAERRRSEHAR